MTKKPTSGNALQVPWANDELKIGELKIENAFQRLEKSVESRSYLKLVI